MLLKGGVVDDTQPVVRPIANVAVRWGWTGVAVAALLFAAGMAMDHLLVTPPSIDAQWLFQELMVSAWPTSIMLMATETMTASQGAVVVVIAIAMNWVIWATAGLIIVSGWRRFWRITDGTEGP